MFATLKVPALCIVPLLSWDPHYRFPRVMELPSIWTVKVIHQEFWIIHTPGQKTPSKEAHTQVYSVATLQGWNWTLELEPWNDKKIAEARVRMSHRAVEEVDVRLCMVRRRGKDGWEKKEIPETMADTESTRKQDLGKAENSSGCECVLFPKRMDSESWVSQARNWRFPFLSQHRLCASPTESLQRDPPVSWMGNKNPGQLVGEITALRFHFYTSVRIACFLGLFVKYWF